MRKSVAVLGMAKFPIPKKIEFARYIVASMAGNANFVTPAPSLGVVTANINSAEAAAVAAKGGGKEETAIMHERVRVLEISLKALCSYVEGIANADSETAESVILGAGLNLKKASAPRVNGFRVLQGKNPGELEVRAESKPRSFYQYNMTQTPDVETTWEQVHASPRSRFVAQGLESGQTYYFRVLRSDKDGTAPMSHVVHARVS